MRLLPLFRLLLVVSIASLAGPAGAQSDPAAEAAHALVAGDFPRARELANQALAAGTRSGEELVPLLRVLATASAHLNDGETARRAFTYLLALDPSYRLDRSAPDEVKSPYMEARGFWSSHAVPLRVETTLAPNRSGLVTHLTDPASLSARVQLRARCAGATRFLEWVRPPHAAREFVVDGLRDGGTVEYSIVLLDEHGNRLWWLGSDKEPRRISASGPVAVAQPAPAAPAAPLTEPPVVRPAPRRLPMLVIGGLFAGLGAAGLVGAGLAHRERQELAARWNAGDCTGSGNTRAEICSDEFARLGMMETLATALYAASGVALVTGTVLLAVGAKRGRTGTSSDKQRGAWACGGGAGWVGVACAGKF